MRKCILTFQFPNSLLDQLDSDIFNITVELYLQPLPVVKLKQESYSYAAGLREPPRERGRRGNHAKTSRFRWLHKQSPVEISWISSRDGATGGLRGL